MTLRTTRKWSWKWALLGATCAALFLGGATAQATPFSVGIGAFSSAPEVTFVVGVTSAPYVENGVTFDAPGALSFRTTGGKLSMFEEGGSLDIVFPSAMIRFGMTAPPDGGVDPNRGFLLR